MPIRNILTLVRLTYIDNVGLDGIESGLSVMAIKLYMNGAHVRGPVMTDTPIDTDQMMTADEIDSAEKIFEAHLPVEQFFRLAALCNNARLAHYLADNLEHLRSYAAKERRELEAVNEELAKALELVMPLAKSYHPNGQTDTAKKTCRSWISSAEQALATHNRKTEG